MLSLFKAVSAFVIAAVSAALPISHLTPSLIHTHAHPARSLVSPAPEGLGDPELNLGQLLDLRPTPEPPAPPAPPADSAPAPDQASAAPAAGYQAPAVAAPRPPAPPPVVVGSAQQALINADRAAAGLPPLSWSPCLAGIAYQNAVRMAAAGAISHANGVQLDLGCGLGSQAGENVGYWSGGINDAQLNTMFMNSPGHRANIMGPYHYVGTAWKVAANGAGYIAVEFS